jgi:hypothetical protein
MVGDAWVNLPVTADGSCSVVHMSRQNEIAHTMEREILSIVGIVMNQSIYGHYTT